MNMKPNDCRLPPQDLTAERSLLGALMLDPEKLAEVQPLIQAADFYADTHAAIYSAIVSLSESDSAVDVVMLAQELESRGALAEIGGPEYLLEILETVPHAAHAAYYASVVVSRSNRRKAIEIGRKLIESSYNATSDETEVVEAALKAAASLGEMASDTAVRRIRPLSELVDEMIDALEAGISPSLYDGIGDIDLLIRGSAPGELIVIAASTSIGKTLLGLQWLHAAASHGVPGMIVSEEMASAMLASRTMAMVSAMPDSEWMKSSKQLRFEAKEHFARSAPIWVTEKCHTIGRAEREIAEAVKKHGVKVVCVDYAQILVGEGFNKQEKVSDVSARMKGVAMKHGIRVILLAQLNRDIDKRPDPTPQLADIRDSAAMGMDADVVLMPFWPKRYDDTYQDASEYRIYCRKNRNRGIREDLVMMKINFARQRAETLDREREDSMSGM